ncbi:MAG: hypothetical protein ACPH9M_06070 [Amylibacter sp.]|tara:strand:- start:673 stop:1164 length:492 start_codon:yes stop_codon:yes gene_type:complete
MTDKKQVKGLLDYISLKPGEEADFATNSGDYVFGMGIGATEEVRDLAIIGRIYINIQKLKNLNKNDNGRPKKSILLGIDQKRVFALWFMIKDWSQVKKSNTSNRDLIHLAKENKSSITTKKLFIGSIATLEQSMSRGRNKLEVDENWNSEICEQLFENLRNSL